VWVLVWEGGCGVISGGAYNQQFRVFMQHIPVHEIWLGMQRMHGSGN